jgi:hypothetical protein
MSEIATGVRGLKKLYRLGTEERYGVQPFPRNRLTMNYAGSIGQVRNPPEIPLDAHRNYDSGGTYGDDRLIWATLTSTLGFSSTTIIFNPNTSAVSAAARRKDRESGKDGECDAEGWISGM